MCECCVCSCVFCWASLFSGCIQHAALWAYVLGLLTQRKCLVSTATLFSRCSVAQNSHNWNNRHLQVFMHNFPDTCLFLMFYLKMWHPIVYGCLFFMSCLLFKASFSQSPSFPAFFPLGCFRNLTSLFFCSALQTPSTDTWPAARTVISCCDSATSCKAYPVRVHLLK